MRGEDISRLTASMISLGSPPHARGRREGEQTGSRTAWITPACAGKTKDVHRSDVGFRDHPRMRGEDCVPPYASTNVVGSPPHARGRPFLCPAARFTTWITPACAGKTGHFHHLVRPRQDHPRMRGEDFIPKSRALYVWGSPPHARGRLCIRHDFTLFEWITPACAGKTPI